MAERRAPGWYRDLHVPGQLRHWNGRSWSKGSRSWPAWAVSVLDVVADPARATGPETGPVLEGPVRPEALRPMGSTPAPPGSPGSLATYRSGSRLEAVRDLPGADGGQGRVDMARAGRGSRRSSGVAGGVAGGVSGGVAGMPVRRPIRVFGALVALAVLMMAATVVGVSRPVGQISNAAGRDAVFVGRATAACAIGLRPLRRLRSSGPATMSVPGATATLADAATQAATAVAAVEGRLRSLPVAADGVRPVQDWLDSWGRFVVDEQLLAGALLSSGPGAHAGGAASPSGVTPAQVATRVNADADEADIFAGANALNACSLSPAGSSQHVVTIP